MSTTVEHWKSIEALWPDVPPPRQTESIETFFFVALGKHIQSKPAGQIAKRLRPVLTSPGVGQREAFTSIFGFALSFFIRGATGPPNRCEYLQTDRKSSAGIAQAPALSPEPAKHVGLRESPVAVLDRTFQQPLEAG